MKSIDKFVLVLVASLALLLAGCGGGSSTPATTPDPTPPPPPDYSGQLLMHHQAAVEATAKAETAGMAAMDAEDSAVESGGMLTTTQVGGDSTKAMMNAQAILDAKDDAAQAVMDAEMAKMDAMTAKTAAEMVPDGTAGKAQAIAALDAAIKVAEAEIKKATGVRDGRKLDDEVFKVVGANGKGTPRSIADTVGMDIAETVSPGTSDGRARGTLGATAPANTIVAGHKYETDDHQGMTWAMIVGEDNVMSERIGTGNPIRMVASVSGMTAADVDADVTATGGTGGTNAYADAFTSDSSTYMGIPGDIFCLGKDCKVTDGKLAGSWYFSPTSSMVYYIRNPDRDASVATPYIAEASYTQYGYWLTTDGTDWTLNTFALSSAGGTSVNVAAGTEADGLADSATYSGEAVGMSVHKTPKAGGGNHIDSGMFTADVSLTAKFGGTPTVSGTVNNFQGDAVGSGWSVRLDAVALAASEAEGLAVASGENGAWAATAYGADATARPDGIFGGFSAHFLDGHAAGAYATRKD
ncbi:MAG: hypothetical protein F4206_09255 [Gammaproteobacteria bacterium]|nr:hypothetical protein [Gammaproteobacteria bacterium]MYG66892.1 hypothetical protein [Gammaproteobacteria bacterium]